MLIINLIQALYRHEVRNNRPAIKKTVLRH
jgi:hypothetical protein